MKFSIIFEFQCSDVSAEGERETLLNCVDQAVFAEEMGFELTDHQLNMFGLCPDCRA